MSEASALTLTPESQHPRRKSGPKLTEADRRAVIAHYMTTRSVSQTAQHFNVHRNTVSDLVRSVRESGNDVLNASWRSEMQKKAITSVNRALDDDSDVYKSGNIAVQALKGLGVFAPDQQSVNVMQLVQNMPADLERLIEPSSDITQPQDVVIDCPISGQDDVTR